MTPLSRSVVPVSLIIVNHDGGDLLERCLRGVAAQTCLPERVVILDNASRDESITRARRFVASAAPLAERVEFRMLEHNVGFAAANNAGIAASDSSLIALLNPDAFPEPDWLAALVAAADRHPDAAAFGSRQMVFGRRDVLDGTGDVLHVGGLAWRAGHGRTLGPGDLCEREIFSPCAAAALYRRAAVVAAGGFDEDFFCYFEDVDLGYRLRLNGHRAIYVPDAIVEHVGGASSGGRRTAFAVYHGHRNLVWCWLKNTPGPIVPAALLAHFAQTILSGLFFAGSGHFGAWWAAKWHAVVGCGTMLAKRSVIQRRRQTSSRTIWRLLDKRLVPRRRD